ncbi:ATP-binding protein [Azospirillum sp. TSO22-1]|uniref:sensor histidine kinase n=1 Tax=Azospirillum sp. TSO22-1 TaxID=716789 RepID=UPI000D65C98F|nr:ATP-binding protein [Azospirillum sp. TSO22-1]
MDAPLASPEPHKPRRIAPALRSPIAIRLIRVTFGLYVLVAALIAGAQIAEEYLGTVREMQRELTVYAGGFENGLGSALWALDTEELQSIVAGMTRIPGIAGVKVVDHRRARTFAVSGAVQDGSGTLWYGRDGQPAPPPDSRAFTGLFGQEHAVQHTHAMGTALVGYVTIYSNSHAVFDRVWVPIAFVLGGAVVKTVALWLIFVFVARRLLVQPLARLTEAVEQMDPRTGHGPLVVPPPDRKDELTELAQAFADLVRRLRAETEARNWLEAGLEAEVRRRTEEADAARRAAERALAELGETQVHLVQAEKMASLATLVAGVAHEINTPVGIVVTASSHLIDEARRMELRAREGNLRRADLDAFLNAVTEAGSIVLSNGRRAAQLVQSFKRVAVDEASEERRTFLLDDYVRDVLATLGPRLSRTPIAVEIAIPRDLDLDSYPGALAQVLTNLLLNALLHAFPDGSRGRIVLAARRDEPEMVELRISDDGCGIAPDLLPRIFDPFVTTRRSAGGSGLGLHVAFNRVTLTLGGSIAVDSALGRGTTFTLRLPRVAPTPVHPEPEGVR